MELTPDPDQSEVRAALARIALADAQPPVNASADARTIAAYEALLDRQAVQIRITNKACEILRRDNHALHLRNSKLLGMLADATSEKKAIDPLESQYRTLLFAAMILVGMLVAVWRLTG
jgi:hypothetical protein